jgi:hypothetical protein
MSRKERPLSQEHLHPSPIWNLGEINSSRQAAQEGNPPIYRDPLYEGLPSLSQAPHNRTAGRGTPQAGGEPWRPNARDTQSRWP